MTISANSVRKVLVTGAAGYIGSVLVPALLEKGYRVTAIDRFFFGGNTLRPHPHLTLIREDSRRLTCSHFAGVEAVIDLAAVSNDPAGEHFARATREINHLARRRTATLAKSAGVSRYILPSSCSVYGHCPGLATETSKAAPLTLYARTNLAAEEDILPLADERFVVTALRQATVFGYSPRMRFDLVVNAMVHAAWSQGVINVMRDGEQRRPLVHVADTAAALMHMLDQPSERINGEIFNVGCERQQFRLRNLALSVADILSDRLGRNIRLQWYGDPDQRDYGVDFDKITRVTGWRARRSLAEGCGSVLDRLASGCLDKSPETQTLDWYRELAAAPPDHPLALYGGMLDLPAIADGHSSTSPAAPEVNQRPQTAGGSASR